MADSKLKNEILDTFKTSFKLKDTPAGKHRDDAEVVYTELSDGLSTAIEDFTKRTFEKTIADQKSKDSIASSADRSDASSIKGNNKNKVAPSTDLTVAETKSLLSIGNVENEALSTWPGSTNVTTLGTITTGVWNGTKVHSDYVQLPAIGSPVVATTLTRNFTAIGSAGALEDVSPFVYYVSPGVVGVLTGEGYLRSTDYSVGDLYNITWPAPANITLATPAAGFETSIWIGVEYNAGVPRISTRTAYDWNFHTDFPLARVNFNGIDTDILNAYAHASDSPQLIRQYLRKVFPFVRESSPEGAGGLIIGVTGTRNVTLTASVVWHSLNKIVVPAFNTSTGSTMDAYYRRAGGGFNEDVLVTQWPNTQYDDGSGTLVTMTNNKYACLWIYYNFASLHVEIVYGRAEYQNESGAVDEQAPTIPDHLTNMGRPIGRFIFQKSAATPASIESIVETPFEIHAVNDHNQLSNLQGGTLLEYYHMTAAQIAALSATLPDNRMPALTGDVTSTVGTVATTVVAASTTVAGKIEIAVQAEMEAGTDNTRCVSPAVQQYHPSSAKAWLYSIVNATVPANSLSYNLTSITDRGVGYLGITIATDFSTGSWAGVATVQHVATTYAAANDRKVSEYFNTRTATYIEYQCLDGTATTLLTKDPTTWSFIAFGDQ